MPYSLSASSRMLLAGLLAIALLFQIAFAVTHLIGHGYAHNGRFTQVQKNWGDTAWFFRQANDWSPYNHHWWYWLAVSEHNLGNTEASITALDQCLKIAPVFVSGLNLASDIMVATGNGSVTLQLTDRAERLVPDAWEPAYAKGAVAFTSGFYSDAMDNLFIADQRSTEPKRHVLGLLSQAAFESGSLELATNAIDRAVAAGKESAWYWMLRGEIHGARGDTDISRDSYERAILLYAAEDSTQVDSKYHQATLHARLGYLYASQSEIVQSIGSFYNASGFYADLVTYSELLLQIHQELPATLLSQTFEMQLQWATVLSAAQLWNDAIEVFARLDSADGNWTPLARYSYGMVLRKSGEPKLALVQFRALSSSDLIPAKAYAETLYEAGQPAAARFEYAKIPTLFNLSETERDEIELRIEELSRP
ncbi:MAG: hypothetical protein VCB26_13705 [Candidatus Hydrogenedentota bacterium]